MSVFRFNFDAQGMEIEHGPVAVPVGVPAAAPAPESRQQKAGGGSKPHRAAPRGSAERPSVVHELHEWLEHHPDFGFDMEILEQLKVLLVPPHWSYVSTPPARDAAAVEDHRQAVQKYGKMLGDRQKFIEDGMTLAAWASMASWAARPAERVRDALRALPEGAAVPRVPGELWQLLSQELPFSLKSGEVQPWAEALQKRIEHIVASAKKPDWDELELESWESWQHRLQRYHAARQDFPVEMTDLLLRTRRSGPAELFRNEMTQMTLREWTRALLKAIVPSRTGVPPWVRSEVEKELWGGRATVLIVIAESINSPTAQWLPSKQFGSLWVERAGWPDLFQALKLDGPNPFSSGRMIVAVEVSGDLETMSQVKPSAFLGVAAQGPVAEILQWAYVGKEKLPPTVTPLVAYIENAKGIDDAVARLDRLQRPSPRPS